MTNQCLKTETRQPVKTKGRPSAIDKYVGQRLKLRRTLLSLSQEQLASRANITFQQIQKYERGFNRISAGRLFEFASILSVPISYFYDGYPNTEQTKGTQEPTIQDGLLNTPEIIKLVKAYNEIKDQSIKKKMLSMLIAISKASE